VANLIENLKRRPFPALDGGVMVLEEVPSFMLGLNDGGFSVVIMM